MLPPEKFPCSESLSFCSIIFYKNRIIHTQLGVILCFVCHATLINVQFSIFGVLFTNYSDVFISSETDLFCATWEKFKKL